MEQMRFDGLALDLFAGQFAGTFDTECNFEMDDEVSFLVVGKVCGATIGTTKTGDLKRVNKFQVVEVGVTGHEATGRRGRAAQAQIAGQLSLDDAIEGSDEDSEEDAFTLSSSSNGNADPVLARYLEEVE